MKQFRFGHPSRFTDHSDIPSPKCGPTFAFKNDALRGKLHMILARWLLTASAPPHTYICIVDAYTTNNERLANPPSVSFASATVGGGEMKVFRRCCCCCLLVLAGKGGNRKSVAVVSETAAQRFDSSVIVCRQAEARANIENWHFHGWAFTWVGTLLCSPARRPAYQALSVWWEKFTHS